MIDINSNNIVTDRLNNETDCIENLSKEIELTVITLRNSENSDINDDDNFFRSATVDFQDKENLDKDTCSSFILAESLDSVKEIQAVSCAEITTEICLNKTNIAGTENFVDNGCYGPDNENDLPSSSVIPSDTNKECTEEKEEGHVEKEKLNNARKRKLRVDKKDWQREKNKSKREKGYEYYGLKKNAEGNWVIDQKREARKLKPFCDCKQSAKTTKI